MTIRSRAGFGLAMLLVATACGHAPPTAGFWFEDRAFTLSADSLRRLGGPLGPEDIDTIEAVSRADLAQAFSGLPFTITGAHHAHWRVSVVNTVSAPGALAPAGGSVQLGALGGGGSVGFVTLATNAIRYAPDAASRKDILRAIGHGIAGAAAHEFGHEILGRAMRDDRSDRDSYEYFSADRASQYFGTLHWTAAWPLLQQQLGG